MKYCSSNIILHTLHILTFYDKNVRKHVFRQILFLNHMVCDKITKPLLAVSKICEQGKSVFFGPGPDFKSFVTDDPNVLVVHNGSKTDVWNYQQCRNWHRRPDCRA